jgi:hypothetical protein
MNTRVVCGCGWTLDADYRAAGKQVTCASCKALLTIPQSRLPPICHHIAAALAILAKIAVIPGAIVTVLVVFGWFVALGDPDSFYTHTWTRLDTSFFSASWAILAVIACVWTYYCISTFLEARGGGSGVEIALGVAVLVFVVLVGIAVVCLLGAGPLYLFQSNVRECSVANEKFSGFLQNVYGLSLLAPKEQRTMLRHVQGSDAPRIAIVKSADGSYDRCYFAPSGCLPRYVIPRDVNEVQMVIFLKRKTEIVRTYRNSGSDYRRDFEVFVFTWPDRQFVFFVELHGASPGDSSGQPGPQGEHFGNEPWRELDECLKAEGIRPPQ